MLFAKVIFALLLTYLPVPPTAPDAEATTIAGQMTDEELRVLTRFEALGFFSKDMKEVDLDQLRVQLDCVIQHPAPSNCNVPHMYHPDVVRDARHLTGWFLEAYRREGRAGFVALFLSLDEQATADMERIEMKDQAQARRLKE